MRCFNFSRSIILMVVTTAVILSQVQCLVQLRTEGRRFMVYPSQLENLWSRVRLYITTRSPTFVPVLIYTPMMPSYLSGSVYLTVSVKRGQPVMQELPAGVTSGMDKLHDGVQVVSLGAEDIAVFINNPSDNASGLTSILANASLGTSYLFASIERTPGAQTSILIGNPEGPNTIRVTLPLGGAESPSLLWKNTRYGPGKSFTITMNSYEFADIRQQTGAGTGDLTGTRIEAEKPVTVFSASVFFPSEEPASVKDITIENIPPVSSWGREFVVVASPALTPMDNIRVLAGQDNVTVTFSNGSQRALEKRGQFFQADVAPGVSFVLKADKPVQVIQYRYRFTADSAPFMFHVPSVESFGPSHTVPIIFEENPTQGSKNYLVLITHACLADRVLLEHDHSPAKDTRVSRLSPWKRVANSDYVITEVKVGRGFVGISVLGSSNAAEDKMATVGGFIFGMGPNKAYAAPLGLRYQEGQPIFSRRVPDESAITTAMKPIKGGKSCLLTRNELPLSLPLSDSDCRSSVQCHQQCWLQPDCHFVAYNTSLPRKAGSRSCLLFGATAGCSGFQRQPGFAMYEVNKAAA